MEDIIADPEDQIAAAMSERLPQLQAFLVRQASGRLVLIANIQGFVGESGRCVACRLPIDPQGRNVFPSVSRKELWI